MVADWNHMLHEPENNDLVHTMVFYYETVAGRLLVLTNV